MQALAQEDRKRLVLLGTGGTIAGLAADPADDLGYTAAQLGIGQLVEAVPALAELPFELLAEQVAQIDSKDMSFAVWQQLAQRCLHHLAQPEVTGLVVTHGTDTLEETAYFLHVVLSGAGAAEKPVVLTGAMRPASSLTPDGPQNLFDALQVAACPGVSGLMVVMAGTVHSAVEVQKLHANSLDAFDSGDTGPLGYVVGREVRMVRNWSWDKTAPRLGLPWERTGRNKPGAGKITAAQSRVWPRVEIVMNYAGASALMVQGLLSHGLDSGNPVRGIVVAATGGGTLHQDLEGALMQAQATGVPVLRSTRCARGQVLPRADDKIPDSGGLSPVKARIALMLSLMPAIVAGRPAQRGPDDRG